MSHSFPRPHVKKAYEIAYAVFRLSSSLSRRELARHLEDKAVSLLAAAVSPDLCLMESSSAALECLVRFGADVSAVSPGNADLLVREIGNFNSAIAAFEQISPTQPVRQASLEDIFSGFGNNAEKADKAGENADKAGKANRADAAEEEIAVFGQQAKGVLRQNGNGTAKKDRRTIILDKIRQNGTCRLRDFGEILPDTSERTIRYDIEELLGSGAVVRIGNGGPATAYKLKD